MGYDIHLTRREYWSDDGDPAISLDQWLDYVASDPEITPDSEDPDPEHFIVTVAGESYPLWWYAGELTTKNPPECVIIKLVEVAKALGARVLGDDDEVYGIGADGNISVERR